MGWARGRGRPWRIREPQKGSRIDVRVYESGSSLEVLDLVSRCNGNGPFLGVIPCFGVAHAWLRFETGV